MQVTRSSTLRLPRVGLLNSIGSLDVLIGVLLVTAASILRFPFLGYSDYQGDEIKALYLFQTPSLDFNYILQQRKGPVQFLITWAMTGISGHFANQGLVRAPFALAGVAA